MNARRNTSILPTILVTGLLAFGPRTMAEIKTFTIDQSQSQLAISGSFAGIQLAEQGPGSLTTSFTGTIEADVSTSSIRFVGGSLIMGENSGNWEPAPGGGAGNAPANYGGQGGNFLASGKAALRNILLDVTSGDIPVTGGSFPANTLTFSFPDSATSAFDYTFSSLLGSGSGTEALAGSSTNDVIMDATLIIQGSETILTIPVDFTGRATAVSPDDVTYKLTGQTVARSGGGSTLPSFSRITITPGQLSLTIATTPGKSYSLLASIDLIDWTTVIDQFTATETTTRRDISIPEPLPNQFFNLQED